jgi:adenosylmethionine-8-amino-7-oxononanoate aminotransferase
MGKAIGGGLPVGVMWAKPPSVAKLLVPGKHGCTLGGNPICMAVSRTIFDVIERDGSACPGRGAGRKGVAKLRNEPRLKGQNRRSARARPDARHRIGRSRRKRSSIRAWNAASSSI